MVIVMSTKARRADMQRVQGRLAESGCKGELTVGVERTIITVVGPISPALQDDVRVLPYVENVVLLSKSYDLAGRNSHPDRTVVNVGGVSIGGRTLALIAGPGTVESRDQIFALAPALREGGANLLAGGSMRPGQSPYAFRGLGEEGLQHLAHAATAAGLKVLAEVAGPDDVEEVATHADALEVGPFNMSNFNLLEAVAAAGKPVLLRRALAATIDEWLLSAEHILYAGNDQVILCESGIRTFDSATPTTIDLSAIPIVQQRSHLPIVVDPSSSSGQAALVSPLSYAALASGADGLVFTVHPNPDHALAGGPQSLTPEQFRRLVKNLAPLAGALERNLPD